jgi:hypothetical protein
MHLQCHQNCEYAEIMQCFTSDGLIAALISQKGAISRPENWFLLDK